MPVLGRRGSGRDRGVQAAMTGVIHDRQSTWPVPRRLVLTGVGAGEYLTDQLFNHWVLYAWLPIRSAPRSPPSLIRRDAPFARLASGEATVTELAQPFEMSLPAISRHLKVLERAGLIARGR